MYVFSLRPKAKDSKNSLSCSSCCWIFRYIKSTSLSLLFLSLSLLPAYLYLLTNLSVYLPISLPTYQSLYLTTNLSTYLPISTYLPLNVRHFCSAKITNTFYHLIDCLALILTEKSQSEH